MRRKSTIRRMTPSSRIIQKRVNEIELACKAIERELENIEIYERYFRAVSKVPNEQEPLPLDVENETPPIEQPTPSTEQLTANLKAIAALS